MNAKSVIRTVALSCVMAAAGAGVCAAVGILSGGWPPAKAMTKAKPVEQPADTYDRSDAEWLAYFESLDRERAEYQMRRLTYEAASDPRDPELQARQALLHEALIKTQREHADIHRANAERAYREAITLWERLECGEEIPFIQRRIRTLAHRLANTHELRGKKEQAAALREAYGLKVASRGQDRIETIGKPNADGDVEVGFTGTDKK